MNWAHFHLLVNDLPILWFFFASLFLAIGHTGKYRDGWVRAGMVMIAVASLGAALSFLSGSPALDVISGRPQTSGRALSDHHVRSIPAIVLSAIAALAGTRAVFVARKNGGSYSRRSVLVVLTATLAAAGALGWTGLAGGRINHPEIQFPADRESGPAHPH